MAHDMSLCVHQLHQLAKVLKGMSCNIYAFANVLTSLNPENKAKASAACLEYIKLSLAALQTKCNRDVTNALECKKKKN